ncbi:putative membrane protein [Melghiribacillus thermohalophilus]|uniref:Putative membrane protein n=1 Tax=Melghiribacillus thermohalophilus TaxID=1324956 RepID=A0A4V2V130_9BACI|nr:cytochrome c oxidase assembly protein [Melghiribacillus thermohalophilus]TCT19632.1 putative membrane protein [Melghiribacillus thermohalophilus]
MSGNISSSSLYPSEIILATPFVTLLFLYCSAVYLNMKHGKRWSVFRTLYWIMGTLFALLSVTGPIARLSHEQFPVHMLGHLLLGMLSPLLTVLGAPVTLLLRTLSVKQARRITAWLKAKPFVILSNPIFASFLNIGGLWLLYTTDLYDLMHQNLYLYLLIHMHVFLAGYVFTASIIYIDPVFHRRSYTYRLIVLTVALGAHSVLSKYIYAYPPSGVTRSEAETGGMLMYYGGDLIDIVLILIFCTQWYKASRPRFRSPVEKH